jgi:hypothetical protein
VGVALLFIDGVGLGRRDPDVNPLARHGLLLSQFEDGSGTPLPQGRRCDVETTFGVPGRPQSATNQTALFTGQPAPALLGKHLLGFPNRFLRELIEEHSIVKRLRAAGRTVTFANGYPSAYLDALGLERRPAEEDSRPLPAALVRRLRPSASTLTMAAGKVPLRTLRDVREDGALTADIDGRSRRASALNVPARSAEDAGALFARLAATHDFTLFEHYLADEAGHLRDFQLAEEALLTFDAFARSVLEHAVPLGTTVLICSDHGNVEDLSTRNHTLGAVSLLVFGPQSALMGQPKTLADVGLGVLRLLGVDG